MNHRNFSRAAVAALAILASAGTAFGQGAIKPIEALVVNPPSRPVPTADATVRDPYQHTVTIRLTPSASCPYDNSCFIVFPAIPAGKRLVLTHASGSVSANETAWMRITDAPSLEAGGLFLLPGRVGSGSGPGFFIASSPVTFYVAAGRTPVIHIVSPFLSSTNYEAQATLVGHLVNAP